MSKIIQLDERLANMIAAGEVVERPSSVVKELVENSIDAGASKIEIDLTDCGVKRIVIKDDGCGMSREDAKMAFSRHATSKIKNEYDLFRIQTLGFRGEAVPSIASVSTFTLLTNDGVDQTKVVYKGGHLEDIVDAPCNKGTVMTVENLFYNVPARLKYLKSLPQELSSITYLVSKFILANPNISFSLTNNGRTIYKTLGNGDMVRIFGELYGLEVARNILTSHYEGHGFKFNLTICKSVVSRANKLEITTIVNNRYVKSNMINQAIIAGYHTYIPEGRYPIALIDIEIDPLLIDVNVHPTKMQIKISNEEEMAKVLETEIDKLLKGASMIPDIKTPSAEKSYFEKTNIFDEMFKPSYLKEKEKEESAKVLVSADEISEEIPSRLDEILATVSSDIEEDDSTKTQEDFEAKKEAELENLKKEMENDKSRVIPYLEYCGQVHGTYLIFQNQEGMYLMDQHAAAERINYEYYLEVLSHPEPYSQILLLPINLEFTNSEMITFDEHLNEFKDLGFVLEQSGVTSYFVRESPMWLHQEDTEDFIRKVLYNISRDNQFKIEKYRDRLAAEIACKASIKANHAITREEVDALVSKLRKCNNPYTCPHGRPTIIKFTTNELEKLFKRIM